MNLIEKVDDVHDTNFNAIDTKRKLRTLSLKINEIIDVVNALIKEYEEDYNYDQDDDIDPSSKLKVK